MSDQCQTCKGTKKLYKVSAKCSDMYSHTHGTTEYDGYVPDWIGEYGDYVSFIICRHCGTVQGDWPFSNDKLNKFSSGKAS